MWGVVKSAHLQSVSLCMFLSSSLGKHIYLNSALIHFSETSMLDIGKGYDGCVGGGEGMVPEKRQEHLPYLSWQISVLTT